MLIWAAIFLVFAFYLQTLNYHYMIDDNVKRDGYLYDVPEVSPSPDFYETKPSRWYRLFMISMHAVNSALVGTIFNPLAGLLFAVHPVCVCGTAWVTGNYYATTAYFFLTALLFLVKVGGVGGVLASCAFMAAAMNSTITAIGVPFAAALTVPWGWTWLWPLMAFLVGKRFKTGYALRKSRGQKINGGRYPFTWRRLVVMTKVVAFYVCLAFYPKKLCFFRKFGDCYVRRDKDDIKEIESVNAVFWGSLFLCTLFFSVGMYINPLATLIFFCGIGAFSQFKFLGQFVAERYLYLPLIGVCAIVGEILGAYPVLTAGIVTALSYRTLQYIPAWKNMLELYKNDLRADPSFNMAASNLGQYYLTKPNIKTINLAYVHLLNSLEVGTECFEVHANMAVCYLHMKQLKLALMETEKAMEFAEGRVNDVVWDTLIKQRDFLKKRVDNREAKANYGPGKVKMAKASV